jgi:O-antigen ligase
MWAAVAIVVPSMLILVPLTSSRDGWLPWLESIFAYRVTGDLSGRLQLWPYAMEMWSESLMTGAGAGTFAVSNPYLMGAHNLVLTLGTDLGLIGAILYAAVYVTALARAGSGTVPRRLVGLFLISLLPIWLTGQWEVSPGAWLVLAVLSTLPLTSVSHQQRSGDGGQGFPGTGRGPSRYQDQVA